MDTLHPFLKQMGIYLDVDSLPDTGPIWGDRPVEDAAADHARLIRMLAVIGVLARYDEFASRGLGPDGVHPAADGSRDKPSEVTRARAEAAAQLQEIARLIEDALRDGDHALWMGLRRRTRYAWRENPEDYAQMRTLLAAIAQALRNIPPHPTPVADNIREAEEAMEDR
ncbi:MAG: hypothetical protein H6739_08575 [Alphaproteobacteria bacterium]|nr:hypothetical protein [Alphaproteobacteria bacterium]